MELAEIRNLTLDQLDDELAKRKKEKFNLRFQKATGQLENTGRVRLVRREIAKIMTVIGEKKTGKVPGQKTAKKSGAKA